MTTLSPWKDKAPFTPDPPTTSTTTKQAMLRDLGSHDHEFIGITKDVCCRLMDLGNGDFGASDFDQSPRVNYV